MLHTPANKMSQIELRQAIRDSRDGTPKHPKLGSIPPVFPVWVVASLATRFMQACDLLTEVRNDAVPERMMGSRVPFVPSREDYSAIVTTLDTVVTALCNYLTSHSSLSNYPDIGWIIPLMPAADVWGDIAMVIEDGTAVDFRLIQAAHKRLQVAVADAWMRLETQV